MTVYLGLGSNRGDRERHLADAIAALPGIGVRVLRVSRPMETAPVGASGRRWFWNCVVEGATALLPRVLLRRLRALERAQGRHGPPSSRKPPRTLDVDLIFYGKLRLRTRELILPHPRFAQRRFVLEGLAELAPTRHPPGSGIPTQLLLKLITNY